MSDVIIGNPSGGDIVFASGPYPGRELLRLSPNATPGSVSGTLVAELSTTLGDGATVLTFAFADPIGRLLLAFIGGVMQLPADCSVDDQGQLVFSANVTPPAAEDLVTALYIAR